MDIKLTNSQETIIVICQRHTADLNEVINGDKETWFLKISPQQPNVGLVARMSFTPWSEME